MTEELIFQVCFFRVGYGRGGLAYIADKQTTHNNTSRYKAHHNIEVDQIIIEDWKMEMINMPFMEGLNNGS